MIMEKNYFRSNSNVDIRFIPNQFPEKSESFNLKWILFFLFVHELNYISLDRNSTSQKVILSNLKL